jgi:SWI/SNF-related matrix-associated actin-dependent regulator of chromatin subfamily A member 5
MLHTGGRTAETRQRIPRAPKQMTIHDYQFFPDGLQELYDKETAFYRKENNLKAPLVEGTDEDLEARQAEQELLQEEIDNAVPLTEEEQELKERYAKQGFGDWNRRDFQQFINGSGKYGRTNYERIADEVDSKTPAQCKEYSKAFWKNHKQIANYEKYITIIDEGEERIKKIVTQQKQLRKKLSMYRVPMQQMKLNYTVSTTNKKVYTEEEDRFILVMLDKYGIDTEGVHDHIRDEIRESALFRFDWFFLSRTPIELARRCTTLLNTVTKEFAGHDGKINGMNGKRKNAVHDEEDEDEEEEPAKKRAKNGIKVCLWTFRDGANRAQNKKLDMVKGARVSSGSTSRASSGSPAPRSKPRAKGKVTPEKYKPKPKYGSKGKK